MAHRRIQMRMQQATVHLSHGNNEAGLYSSIIDRALQVLGVGEWGASLDCTHWNVVAAR